MVTAAGAAAGSAPRVSVVIPVHNGERFVADSIRSVLAQTRSVLECVVVDDGSTDGTMDVLNSFGRDIRVIRRSRAGVAASRNAGMDAAQGDVFAFLDADDVWMPHKVERQLPALASAGTTGAVYSGYVIGNSRLRPRRVVLHRLHGRPVVEALLVEAPGIGFSFTGMTTRGAAERVGRFDERLSTSSDLEYVWRLARECRVVGVREALAVYRRHGRDQMHRDLTRLEHDMRLVLDEAEAAGLGASAARRGRANLETHLAARSVLRGAIGPGLSHLWSAGRADSRRPLALAVAAAVRRVRQHAAVLAMPGAPLRYRPADPVAPASLPARSEVPDPV